VHTPLQAKSELVQQYEAKINPSDAQNNATYAAMIQSLDEAVGRLLTKLKELDLEKNTVVIFMSDNGGLARVTSNSPLRAGKGSAYEGGHRTPMFIKWSDVIPAGSTCDTPVTSVDFFPTILEMAGLKLPESGTIDGVSLIPLLNQQKKFPREAIFWHYPHYHPGGATPYSAIRNEDYKLIEYLEDGKLELYNLNEDIGETTDLSATRPARTRELHEQLKKWRIEVNARMPVLNPDYVGKGEGMWEWEVKTKK
jgi:arylsulfatase A-like enzyme